MWKLSKREQYEIESYLTGYGFFFNGTKSDHYLYEFNVMGRKLMIIFATEFLRNTSAEVQVLVSIIIVILNLMLQLRTRPFTDNAQHAATAESQNIQMILMYVGLCYMTNAHYDLIKDPTSAFHYICFPLILIPSLLFFFGWFKIVIVNFLMLIYLENIKVFRLVTWNLWDSNKFYRTYLEGECDSEDSAATEEIEH